MTAPTPGARCASQARGVPAIEGGGSAASIEGADAPYEDWLRQYFYPHSVPNTKRTSHKRGSYTLPEFVPKNQGFQIWRNAFGAKNGAQAKRRVEAYLTYARKQAKGAFRYAAGVPRRGESSESIAVIRSPHKIPPMRGSYTLPEFVPENQGFQIWRNDFGAKNGAQAKRRIEAY